MPELVLHINTDEVTIVASASLAPEDLLNPGLTVDIGRITHEGQYLFLYLVRGKWERMFSDYHPVLFSKALFTCEPEAWDADAEGDALLQTLVEEVISKVGDTTDEMRLLMLAKMAGLEV